MILLRLIGYLLVYTAIAIGIYYFFVVNDTMLLLIAIGLLLIGGLLLYVTQELNQRKSKHQHSSNSYWDWWDIIEWLDVPFRLMIWLIKSVVKIFD